MCGGVGVRVREGGREGRTSRRRPTYAAMVCCCCCWWSWCCCGIKGTPASCLLSSAISRAWLWLRPVRGCVVYYKRGSVSSVGYVHPAAKTAKLWRLACRGRAAPSCLNALLTLTRKHEGEGQGPCGCGRGGDGVRCSGKLCR